MMAWTRTRASSRACASSNSTSQAESAALGASKGLALGIRGPLSFESCSSGARAASIVAMLAPESAGVFTASGSRSSFSVGCWMASCAVAAPAPPSTRPATSRRILTRDVLSRCSLVPQWAKRDSNPRPPACKAGALNRLSHSPVAPRALKGEAYREENAVAENQQNRRGGGRPASQQHVPGRERYDPRCEKQPVPRSEVQTRAGQTVVGHKADSLRRHSKLVKHLGRP